MIDRQVIAKATLGWLALMTCLLVLLIALPGSRAEARTVPSTSAAAEQGCTFCAIVSDRNSHHRHRCKHYGRWVSATAIPRPADRTLGSRSAGSLGPQLLAGITLRAAANVGRADVESLDAETFKSVFGKTRRMHT
jgi:hypothetical protein